MTLNELKKILYKEKPTAKLLSVNRTGIKYTTEIAEGPAPVNFFVPMVDIGDGEFMSEMPAQLLIRYLVELNDDWK